MQLPNQRSGKPDKLSHNACNPDKLSHNAMQNSLNKKGVQSPKVLDKQSSNKENAQGQLSYIKQETSRDHTAGG